MHVDMNVNITKPEQIPHFVKMAKNMGLDGLAVTCNIDKPVITFEDGFRLYKRACLKQATLPALKTRVSQIRRFVMIVAVPLRSVQLANWAADDARVDLLTLSGISKEESLKSSTARLAASSGTALEVQMASLLTNFGLDRSRAIKTFRESIRIAQSAGMPIILSSGAKSPMMLRSPRAMLHIARLLGIDDPDFMENMSHTIEKMLSQNQRKLSNDYIAPGMEIVWRPDQ